MWYTTTFSSELKFTTPLTTEAETLLADMMGEDRRDHPEWGAPVSFNYIDLEFNDAEDGLRHNGAEKTYGMVDIVNTVTRQVRKVMPDFKLIGELRATGESPDDNWIIRVDDDGVAHEIKCVVVPNPICCPKCKHEFNPKELQK